MDYKLIIFDCDGTLVDSERLSNKLIADMMNEVDININESQTLKLFKGTHFKLINDYVQKHKTIDIAFDFESEFRTRCDILFKNELKPIQGVEAFIKNLRIPYCVASNGPHVKMKTSLKATGLDKLFKDNIFSAYDINKFKPAPDLFLYASNKMNIRPEACLVIEDTVPGIKAALAANMDVWGVLHPGVNDEINEFQIKTFRSFEEINI